MKKKVMIFGYIIVTILLINSLTVAIPIQNKNQINIRTNDAKNVKISSLSGYSISITHVEASSPYDYGFKVGNYLKGSYSYSFLFILSNIFDNSKIDKKCIENQIKNLEQYCPSYLEELRGLSASTKIKLENLLVLQTKLRSLFDCECTATLATGEATKNNETFLTFNVDAPVDSVKKILFQTILHRILSFRFFIVKILTLKYKYAFWGVPVLYEFPFLNEEGLGWGSPGTLLTENQSRKIDEGPGIPTMLLERLAMMTCKNVSEVAKLYKENIRASQKDAGFFNICDCSSSCFCDKEGGILFIEQTHNYIITVFGNSTDITGAPNGILWHANHHQWLNPNLTGSIYPNEDLSSAFRAERTRELLETNYGNITLEVCEEITKDHGGGYNKNSKDSGDICRHPDRHSLKVTVFAWIVAPKELSVYWVHTSPCKDVFHKHDFSENFAYKS